MIPDLFEFDLQRNAESDYIPITSEKYQSDVNAWIRRAEHEKRLRIAAEQRAEAAEQSLAECRRYLLEMSVEAGTQKGKREIAERERGELREKLVGLANDADRRWVGYRQRIAELEAEVKRLNDRLRQHHPTEEIS